MLDAARDNEAKARKVMVRRKSEYRGSMSVETVKPGALKGGEMIVNEGAKNVSNGQAVRIANL